MNNQEAFERVCRHLKQQNARSVKSLSDTPSYGPRCSYAGENGMSCAVGCLFPRELAEELDTLDDSSWDSISAMPRYFEDEYSNVDPAELELAEAAIAHLKGVSNELLADLQQAHDRSDSSETPFWEQVLPRLESIARKYALKLPPELQSLLASEAAKASDRDAIAEGLQEHIDNRDGVAPIESDRDGWGLTP